MGYILEGFRSNECSEKPGRESAGVDYKEYYDDERSQRQGKYGEEMRGSLTFKQSENASQYRVATALYIQVTSRRECKVPRYLYRYICM